MVVVTEYEFDSEKWRAAVGRGPGVLAVEVGIENSTWSGLSISPGPLVLWASGQGLVSSDRREQVEDLVELVAQLCLVLVPLE